MARRSILAVLSVLAMLGAIALWNYITVYRPASQAISADTRNNGVDVSVHYKWFIDPSVLVFDLRGVSADKSAADVTRTLLQTAESLKNINVDFVILSNKGNPKFMLNGSYFHTLGIEYQTQNPIYTLRTLPENVYNLDGTQAFETWTGGWIGVVGKQMEDLNEFNRRWFLSDLLNDS